jgi:hypothetical protein
MSVDPLDDFFVDTGKVRETAKAIKDDTDNLRSKTTTWLNKIDDTSKQLPSMLYQNSWAAITDIKAFLNRSMEERDRINTILQEVAKQVDALDQEIKKAFQGLENSQPPQK